MDQPISDVVNEEFHSGNNRSSFGGPSLEKSIVHIFLTKQTPERLEDDLFNIEENILNGVAHSIKKVVQNSSGLARLSRVQDMFHAWVKVQLKSVGPIDHEVFMSEMERLKVGKTIPIYVRKQNCTMMISKIQVGLEERIRVQTFRSSLPSEMVMSNVNSLVMTFPETSNIIENENMLKSNIYASHLYEMTTEEFPQSMGITKKGGSSYTITRDPPRPFLVSEWAVGILVPGVDETALSVTKKIRDHVSLASLHSKSFLPFRRSGMWMSIKVALHLKILEVFQADVDTARVVYKIIMIHIMTDACKDYNTQGSKISSDLASQMMAKIGRRVEKLKRLRCGNCDPQTFSQVELMKSTVLDHTLKVLTILKKNLESIWDHVAISPDTHRFQPIHRPWNEFEQDLLHQIYPLDSFVIKFGKLFFKPDFHDGEESNAKKAYDSFKRFTKQRFTTLDQILQANHITTDTVQKCVWLYDTEQFVKRMEINLNALKLEGSTELYSGKIFDVAKRYITEARYQYGDNPIGFSQMMLVVLKLTYILDTIAANKHPILKNYMPEINASTFDCLLLPHKEDMNLLNELLDYFKRRDQNGTRPILEWKEVDQDTLAVKFAEQDEEMMTLKAQIQYEIQFFTTLKLQEVAEARRKCHELENSMQEAGGSCSCLFHARRGKVTCQYCELKEALTSKRMSVQRYQVPLPPNECDHFQNAVVFELQIPHEIAHLRQILAILRYELLGEHAPAPNPSYHWLHKGNPLIIHTRNRPNIIALTSNNKPANAIHLSKRNADVDLLANSDGSFIVNNIMNCRYEYRKERESVKLSDKCSFRLNNTADSEPYMSLQDYLVSTKHSQNEVIANQSECHKKLSLNEFITFGSLRAGHRIQLRNLYRAISSRNLSLQKQPVLALILQAIWQVGPRDKNGAREAHLDFQLDEFAFEFLEMLEKLVKSIESTYSTPIVLMTAIFITARIMELNEKYRGKCYQLFKEWRKLTTAWCNKINEVLLTYPKDTDKSEMHKTLQEIHTCSMMTYFICSPCQIANICQDSSGADIIHFLQTISATNQLSKTSNSVSSGFMKTLKAVEQIIPIRIIKLDGQNQGRAGIEKFLLAKIPQSVRNDALLHETTIVAGHNIMMNISNKHFINLDVLTGELLINGISETELSSQFYGNSEFGRFFQKRIRVPVQRNSACVICTTCPIDGKHYYYRFQENKSDLAIVEVEAQAQKPPLVLVLVPHQTFRGFISDHLIDNYTHWLDPEKDTVYFRKLAVNDNDYDLSHQYILTKQTGSTSNAPVAAWLLHDGIGRKYFMSIKSKGFGLITGVLSRLELNKHIHLYMDNELKTVEAQLPRHKLRFTLNENGLLNSLEYSGYQISSNQDFGGTLAGLQSGLLLKNGEKRKIIIPLSNIQIGDYSTVDGHQQCKINLVSFSQPSFYIYEIDMVLRRIVAKKSTSAWLYLAALHAVTSSSLPDPLTGMTGTEMAVNILQSAAVWSCSLYEKESLEILKFIKGLSPQRKYYGYEGEKKTEAFETTEWPLGIPSMVAYEGYAFLVNHLIGQSLRLKTLHQNRKSCIELSEYILKDDFSEKLLFKSYLRNVGKYNDQVRLKEDVLERLVLKYCQETEYKILANFEKNEFLLEPAVNAAYIGFITNDTLPERLSNIPLQKNTMIPFLNTSDPLNVDPNWTADMTLRNLLNNNAESFRYNWFKYYALARSKVFGVHELNIWLSALAYCGISLEQIINLLAISSLIEGQKETFPPLQPLPIKIISDPSQYDYNESKIADILKSHIEVVEVSNDRNTTSAKVTPFNAQIEENCKAIAKKWKKFWSRKKVPKSETTVTTAGKRIIKNVLEVDSTGNINASALDEVNKKLSDWFYAGKVQTFLDNIEKKLNNHSIQASLEQQQSPIVIPKPVNTRVQSQISKVLGIQILDVIDQNDFNPDFWAEVANIFQFGTLELHTLDQSQSGKILHVVNLLREQIITKIDHILNTISENILNNTSNEILHESGLIPRFSPTNLLKSLQGNDIKNVKALQCSGALGVLWSELKKIHRCLHLLRHGEESDLRNELLNTGYQNWKPVDHPEWLLIELELDITIRKVQVQVANQMINMPDGGNGVTQLNMGEGKTSVIVPMVCSTLAKDDSLCRVTVLNSIFNTNWDILKFTIGGLLNRRLYSFPCRRDLDIDETCVKKIQEMYEECMQMKGVVLTLPEHRLSFRLLAYDNILKERFQLGLKLLATENWLRWHARDILDESDELLSVNYNLVYTVGERMEVDGGVARWLICQKVLDLVQDIASDRELVDANASMMEYELERKLHFPHEFSPIRFLATKENETFQKAFNHLIVKKYLEGIRVNESQMEPLTEFLTKDISVESHQNVISLLKANPQLLDKILILAGYVRQGVLSLALVKRWRVEYGVDSKGAMRMAVPFRAKDVAAERTEFGHPDLAIILTHLSYYYSGLYDEELDEAFTVLGKLPGPQEMYSAWIKQIPKERVPNSLANFHLINLKDVSQKSKLFDLLRRHKMVVDFWLSNVVLPKESKRFPGRLVMTASDLVYERQRLPVTGFSGTNDSRMLLPLTIMQQDLPNLTRTNDRMEEILKQPENQGNKGLPMGVTCEDILRQMMNDKIQILIDSGALMLDLDNEQVAELWLKIDQGIEAVVYFSKQNQLMVKSKQLGLHKNNESTSQGHLNPGHKLSDVPFELSPFQGKLECCGVFLDDQHTRGTDLNFPLKSRACVTIGSRMKREKLIQSCMRMRKLGSGHAVTFYLSHEASVKVMTTQGNIPTSSVLEWVKQNTKEFNEDGLFHWAIASKHYAKRLVAEDIFHGPNVQKPLQSRSLHEDNITENAEINKDANILAKMCVDYEVTTLMEMYGKHLELIPINDVIKMLFDDTKKRLRKRNRARLPENVIKRFEEIRKIVLERCKQYVPEKRILSVSITNEGQEKELEKEKEQEEEDEQQVERPKKVAPAKHALHPNVMQMVKYGQGFHLCKGVLRLSDVFKNTSFAGEVQSDLWAVEVFVTNDFISVIRSDYAKSCNTDSFLRPMEYFTSCKKRNRRAIQFLFLSPFEANELLPEFRNHQAKCPLHMFASRIFENQNMLFNLPMLQLPPAVVTPTPKQGLNSGALELASLLIASGSLYFSNSNERQSYEGFLSILSKLPKGCTIECITLVRKILRCRHPDFLGESSQVVRLLDRLSAV